MAFTDVLMRDYREESASKAKNLPINPPPYALLDDPSYEIYAKRRYERLINSSALTDLENASALAEIAHENFKRSRYLVETLVFNQPIANHAVPAATETSHHQEEQTVAADDACRRRRSFTPKSKNARKRKRSSSVRKLPAFPVAAADMPERIRAAIERMGGTDAALVIQKKLFKTDLSRSHNRLSIPLSAIMSPAFLKDDEFNYLQAKDEASNLFGMSLPLVEPDGVHRRNITLKRWDMKKTKASGKPGKTTSTYALNKTWSAVVNRHRLSKGAVIQLWSFRVQSDLCLALAVLP